MQLYAHFAYHLPLTKWLHISNQIKGRYSFIKDNISYYNNRALGYREDYVRGYQYYVIDGQDFFLAQIDVNFKVLDIAIPLLKKIPVYYVQTLPIKVHLRYHLDFGYVWDSQYAQGNNLSNTDLIGTGVGVDIILYNYNIIFQFEYTINKSGENGLYLKYKIHF